MSLRSDDLIMDESVVQRIGLYEVSNRNLTSLVFTITRCYNIKLKVVQKEYFDGTQAYK